MGYMRSTVMAQGGVTLGTTSMGKPLHNNYRRTDV